MAISVVLAVGAVADPLIAAIRERVARIKVGPASEPASEMGPLISREHRDRVAAGWSGCIERHRVKGSSHPRH